ncbi:MAG: hypothetical protein EAZ65_03655 [Verrucomicrobia bacterium]|nr:MAG: hypothetical protein EAZ84_02960 [Verrucomicrobiota bacterium]TAE88468.1 MAG: hypothetical protein EAZ82_04340 [Verrucomicrobiota bacterium]TAF26923.1 MAG: hypothetical protein EAZ71_03655 [Verrucomicrobiota bacterium]TAF42179.1 MAG: hypothetical protein EAZ65_03655 [Verrucomicrobiota bacterium]
MQRPWLPALVLLCLLIGFRTLGAAFSHELPNFQPLPALFFCSVIFLRGRGAWAIPVGAWMISSPLASWLQGYNPIEAGGGIIVAFIALLASSFMGLSLRRKASPAVVLTGGLAMALVFHFVTNVAVWLADPLYAKSLTGLWQALWSGRPSDPMPTWIFFRNLAAANVLFTALFLLARHSWSPAATPSTVVARTR